MFYQRVQRAKSDAPLRQQNRSLSPQSSDNFKPLPLPATPDGQIDLSRFPTSDWMKNDPLLRRWAQEEAATNLSDTSPATDVAQRTWRDDRTLSPELEAGNINSTSLSNPLAENLQARRERLLEPMISRFPTSDWMKNDPMLRRWAQEEAAAKSSDTSKIAPSIQAKLTVSTPGDKYELEADAMAAKVMAMPDSALSSQQQAGQSNSTTAAVQRMGAEDKTVSPDLENRIHNATGGSPLPEDVRTFMESRFGVDFSAIRVHTDSNAAQMCKEVGAKAFAVGNRIYYGAGYAPGKNELTAHELTHTVQQGAAKRFNRQVKQLPEPQEELVAKEINIVAPYNNRQMRRFPTEEVAPTVQKVEPGFNRISRSIALEEIPSSRLPAKQFTSKAEPNFNRIQPVASDKLMPAQLLEAKPLVLQKQEEDRSRATSKTERQIQGNWLQDRAIQAFEELMKRVGGPAAAQVVAVLRRAGNAFGAIVKNPKGFLANLVNALQTGFRQFSGNIVKHLKNGLVAWLTGTLSATGLSVPNQLDARGIVSIVLSVLGINYERVRNILVQRIGGAKVKQLESGFDLIQRLANGGLAAAVQHMMHLGQTLQQLQTTVIESVRNWVIETVVRAAISKLVATFSGFGAIAVAVQGIYNAIAFLIERASQIQALVEAVAASIGNIAAGQVSQAANYIESTLARSLSVAISFLARMLNLGNVGQKVREIIDRVRLRIDAAVNKLVDYVIGQGNSWLANVGKGSGVNRGSRSSATQQTRPNPAGQNNQRPVPNNRPYPQQQQAKIEHDRKVKKGLAQIKVEQRQYLKNGRIWKQDARAVAAKVKRENPIFQSITVVDGGQTWDYNWVASQGRETGGNKAKGPQDLKVGDEVQVKGYKQPLKITEIIPADEFVKAGGGGNKVTLSFKTYGQTWNKHNPHASYKKEEAFDRIKDLNEWNNYEDARQVLNYRYHKKFNNPSGMEWHHIHEQSLDGPNSVDNLVLATQKQNADFNHWFGAVQIANRDNLSLRKYLRKENASAYECRKWGEDCLKAFGLKAIRQDSGRGPFQILVKR